MPVYEYLCSSCRHRFEVIRGLNEAGPQQCPLCEGPVTRAFAPPTIHFKGTGWAKKDRRSSGAPTKKASAVDSTGGESKAGDSPSTSSGSSESTGADSPSQSSGSGDSKGGESKGGDSKGGDSKGGDSPSRSSGSGE